ncbi:MAG: glycosyl hydrolase family 28 protein [Opitutales bacterium]|nr:glycosyl hydrolase family 28 protein [Opitutales bacterium]
MKLKLLLKSVCICSCTTLILSTTAAFASNSSTFDVVDYGASPEREGLDTQAIQSAIDAAFENGGGTVIVPPGDYESGPLFLKNNVTFEIQAGATLWATGKVEAYFTNETLPDAEALANRKSLHTDFALINGTDLENATITGKGRIHGEGKTHWWEKRRVRPYTIKIDGGKNIRFEDVTTIESMFHTFNFSKVEGLIIRGITLHNEWRSPNTDGIHLMGSKFVSISDVNMHTGDDCVLTMGGTHDVTITNCRFSTPYGILWISNGSRITLTNCVVTCQMIVKDIRKADDVIVSNIVADGEGRLFSSMGGPVTRLQMDNIIATGFSQGGWFRNADDVSLTNIRITRKPDSGNPSLYNGIDLQGIKNLHIDNVRIEPVQTGPGLYCKDVEGVNISGFVAKGLNDGSPAIRLENANDIYLTNYAGRSKNTYLEILGDSSGLNLGDIRLNEEIVKVADSVDSNLVRPANVSVSNINYPSTINAGESFSITCKLTSTDDRAGLYPLQLSINGKLDTQKWIWLAAGETKEVQIDGNPQYAKGDYSLKISGQPTKTVSLIPKPAEARILSQTLAHTILPTGDQNIFKATIQNVGSDVFERPLELKTGDQIVAKVGVRISPGGTLGIELPFAVEQAGIWDLSLDGKNFISFKSYTMPQDSSFIKMSFDEIEDSVIRDLSGLNNHLALAHLKDGKLPWIVEGRHGKALRFDGYTSYGEFSAQWFRKPMTISVLVQKGTLNEGSTAGRQMLLYAGEPKGTDGYGPEEETHLMHGTGNQYVWWSNAESPRINLRAPIPESDGFHHLVVVYDEEPSIWVDGEKISVVPPGAEPNYSNYADRVWMGRPTTERIRFFNGAIDEFEVFAEPLNKEEIQALYQSLSSAN